MEVKDLKPGDRFNFIPKSWHGPSEVVSVQQSGKLVKLSYDNPCLIRSPGVGYYLPSMQVRRLQKKRKPKSKAT